MVNVETVLGEASEALDARRAEVDRLSAYVEGRQAGTFLSPTAVKATQGRLRSVPVNVVRTALEVLSERLSIQGFAGDPDGAAWRIWRESRMVTGSHAAHVEALAFGCSYVSTWTDPTSGRPRLVAESPSNTWLDLDPVTGEPRLGVRRWYDRRAKRGKALVITPETITRMQTAAEQPDATFAPNGWTNLGSERNALRLVPISHLPNRPRLDRPFGESEIADLLGLADALAKTLQDMLVVSEAHSRPRRWATGLEVVEEEMRDADGEVIRDADGEPLTRAINPFSESPERVWQAESSEVRFGEFGAASLAGFETATGIILREIAAVSGLPPAVLGISGDQPASADALRASEVTLVTKARQRATTFGEGWARAMRLARIIETGYDRPEFDDIAPAWRDFESRSEIVAADRAAKLHAIGVPLEAILSDLDWSPQDIARVLDARRREALNTLGTDLDGLMR